MQKHKSLVSQKEPHHDKICKEIVPKMAKRVLEAQGQKVAKIIKVIIRQSLSSEVVPFRQKIRHNKCKCSINNLKAVVENLLK